MAKFNIRNLSGEQKKTRRRILEISLKQHLSHLGSCLSCVDIIDAVYRTKSKKEKFVLSNGHAGIAWYVILEKNKLLKSADIEKLHLHPDRNPEFRIDASSGSLGQGLPIAIGMAIANRNKNVYCAISDGECTEGSIWESLRIAQELKTNNLKILINVNGWGAYSTIDTNNLLKRLRAFIPQIQVADGHNINKIIDALKTKRSEGPNVIFAITEVNQLPFLKGQGAHYYVMDENDCKEALELLK